MLINLDQTLRPWSGLPTNLKSGFRSIQNPSYQYDHQTPTHLMPESLKAVHSRCRMFAIGGKADIEIFGPISRKVVCGKQTHQKPKSCCSAKRNLRPSPANSCHELLSSGLTVMA